MTLVPDAMPVLSTGKHRKPHTGGCFMELASFLAGERWSDHPKCTDPTLAELARCINDVIPDTHRSLLAPMIPSVIGTGPREVEDRVQIAARIVRTCAVTALPLVRTKAGPIACALLVTQRIMCEKSPVDAEALAAHPEAHAYARTFVADNAREWTDSGAYLTRAAPHALRCIIRAVDDDLGAESPRVLTEMLARSIAATRHACGLPADSGQPSERLWRDACDLVGLVER